MNFMFWDIDGTLLQTGKAGLYAFEQAFTELTGQPVTLSRFAAGGRTDNYICQQLLLQATGQMPEHDEVARFCRRYEELLLPCMRQTKGEVFYPIREILPFFHERRDFTQLLLTGNSARGARLKVEYYGLAQYFDFDHSGFAGDFYLRDDMAHHALDLVRQDWGDEVEQVFVIGDTPYDIQCGKAIGAKTVAVATGSYSVGQLQEYDPWWAVSRLPAPSEVLQHLQPV